MVADTSWHLRRRWPHWLKRLLTSRVAAICVVFLIVAAVPANRVTGSPESQAIMSFGTYTFIQIMFARRDSRMTRSFTPERPATLAAYCGHLIFSMTLLISSSGIFSIGMNRKPGDEFVAALPLLFAAQTAIVIAHGFIADWRAEYAASAKHLKPSDGSVAQELEPAQ